MRLEQEQEQFYVTRGHKQKELLSTLGAYGRVSLSLGQASTNRGASTGAAPGPRRVALQLCPRAVSCIPLRAGQAASPSCTAAHRAQGTMEMEHEESREMGQDWTCRGTVASCQRQKHNDGKPMSKEEMSTL